MNEVIILVDSPNIGRGVLHAYGGDARPDYRALFTIARNLGGEVYAFAFVNDGVSACFVRSLARLGYRVIFSHARDVDEYLVAKAVAMHRRLSDLVLASGDGGFCPLLDLLHSSGTRILLAAVSGSCSRHLRAHADSFVEMPVMSRGRVESPLTPAQHNDANPNFTLVGGQI